MEVTLLFPSSRVARAVATLAVIAACSSCAAVRSHAPQSGAPAPSGSTTSAEAHTVVNAVNSYRAAHGLGPLSVASTLVNKAQYWANSMAAGTCGSSNGTANICHSDLAGGITASWLWLGENVGAASPRSNLNGVIVGFEQSPGHRANILSTLANSVGVGVAYSGNDVYVVEEFMET
jgi:uncharacterized protein YkwD